MNLRPGARPASFDPGELREGKLDGALGGVTGILMIVAIYLMTIKPGL